MFRFQTHYMVMLFSFFFSCKETEKQRIVRLLEEWENKEIIFPDSCYFTKYGKDTVGFPLNKSDYKIIMYVDSIGCVDCKMQLELWKWFIDDLDSITTGKVPVGFFIHPEEKGDMQDLLKDKSFDYPVCLDMNNELYALNVFPNDIMFRTFLLDKENKVIAVGNPVHNLKIWKMYLRLIEDNLNNNNKLE